MSVITETSTMQEIERLRLLGDGESMKRIAQIMMDHEDVEARAEAARALAGAKGIHPSVALLRVLRNDDPAKRARAAEALGVVGGDDVVEGLVSVLNDPVEAVRIRGVRGLGRLGGARAESALRSILSDTLQGWETRLEAADVIAQTGDAFVVDTLVEWAESFYPLEIADLGAQDKRTIVHNLLLGLFERLPEEELLLQTVHIGRQVDIVGGSAASGGAVTERLADPVGTAVKEALASRQGGAGKPNELDADPAPAAAPASGGGMLDFDFLNTTPETPPAKPSAPSASISGTFDVSDILGTGSPSAPAPAPEPEPAAAPAASPEPLPAWKPLEPVAEDRMDPDEGSISSSTRIPTETIRMMGDFHAAPESDADQLPDSRLPGMPEATGAVAALLEKLRENGLSCFVVVGSAIRDLLEGRAPERIDLAVRFEIPPTFRRSRESDLEWNQSFADAVSEPLARLAEVLGVELPVFVEEGARIGEPGAEAHVRYVGPYVLESRVLERGPHRTRHVLEQKVSRLAFVSDRPTGRLTGLVSTTTLDRLGLTHEGGPLPGAKPGLSDFVRNRLLTDSPAARPGILDLLETLAARFERDAELAGPTLDLLEQSVAAIAADSASAREELDLARWERLERAAVAEALAETFEMLEATKPVAEILGEERFGPILSAAAAWNQRRLERLEAARAELEAARAEMEVRKATSDERSAKFTEASASLAGARAASSDLIARRKAIREALESAETAAHEIADKLDEVTARFSAATAAGKADVALIREHREALAARRDADAAVEARQAEEEAVEVEVKANREELARLQAGLESLGAELEEGIEAYEVALAAVAEREAAVAALAAEIELTPEIRRAKLARRPSAA